MARELQPCGTYGAYQRHLANGEDPCDACTAANTDATAAYRERLASYGGDPFTRMIQDIAEGGAQ